MIMRVPSIFFCLVCDLQIIFFFCSFVLRPKDPYLDRPLPFIIGTEEWHKKWHVGLQDTSSDEGDSDKLSDNYSDDDSDLPLDENDLLNEEQVEDINFCLCYISDFCYHVMYIH